MQGYSWNLLISGFLMFAVWTAAYITIIGKAYKDKAYGIPLIDSCLNVNWEFFYSFNLPFPLPPFIFPLAWGNRLWLIFDAINVTQLFLYGRELQTIPWVKKHFYWITAATLLLCGVGLYNFLIYFNDPYGVSSSVIMDILMSVLFISMLLKRRDLRGLSYSGAWLRMAGNAIGFYFLYFWWPAQFKDGRLIYPPHVPEPPSYTFLIFLYMLIPAVDCLYIYLFWKRRRELAAPATEAVAT